MDYISCPLRNFNCSEYIEPINLKYGEGNIFILLYNDVMLSRITSSYKYKENFGTENLNYYRNTFVCFSSTDHILNDKSKAYVLVNNFYINCETFSNALWFIKDNAVTPYWTTMSSKKSVSPIVLRRSVYYTTAKGNFEIVNYSREELEKAMKWYEILEGFLYRKHREEIDTSTNLTNMSNYISFNVPSFNRAYYYLNTARNTEFLPSKIASYISVLETIFAANGENTQKIAERTAYFIGESIDERISIYDDVKSIYDIRSCYVHGSLISDKKHQTMPEISEKADNLVRRVLKKAYEDYPQLNYLNKKDKTNPTSMNNIEVDRWFNELILRKE